MGGLSWVGEEGAEWVSGMAESALLWGLVMKDGGLREGDVFTGG